MSGFIWQEQGILDGSVGDITLIDMMPRPSLSPNDELSEADMACVDAARASFAKIRYDKSQPNYRLLRRLVEHDHSSPFEMVEWKFGLRVPKEPVWHHLERYRLAEKHSVNESSQRYADHLMFYLPNLVGVQSESNKQASAFYELNSERARAFQEDAMFHITNGIEFYKKHVQAGVSREDARTVFLAGSVLKHIVWKMNSLSLLHIIVQRCGDGVQRETRLYGIALARCFKALQPLTFNYMFSGHGDPDERTGYFSTVMYDALD